MINQSIKKLKLNQDFISFSDENLKGVEIPHQDPLVISANINNYSVHRILVDTGASIDIENWKELRLRCIKGSQLVAKTCNISAIQCQDNAISARKKKALEVLQNSTPKYLKTNEKLIPSEEMETIELGEEKELKIGIGLSEESKKEINNILRQNIDIFAWDESDLKGIDSRIVEHK